MASPPRTYYALLPESPHSLCRRPTAYGTLFYVPPGCTVDMGVSPRDWRTYRATRAPRALLVSTWADSRLGFPGGGISSKVDAAKGRAETPAEALSREFLEETGAAVAFTDADFLFAVGDAAPAAVEQADGAGGSAVSSSSSSSSSGAS